MGQANPQWSIDQNFGNLGLGENSHGAVLVTLLIFSAPVTTVYKAGVLCSHSLLKTEPKAQHEKSHLLPS